MIVGTFHFKDYGFEDKRAVDEKGNPITSLELNISKAQAPYSWQRKFTNTIFTNGLNEAKRFISNADKAKAIDKALGFASPEFMKWLETTEEGQRSKKGMVLYNNKKRFYRFFGLNEMYFHLIEYEKSKHLSLTIKFFEKSLIDLGKEELIKKLKSKFLNPECSDEFSSICLDVMKFIKVSVYETNKMKIDYTEMVEIINTVVNLRPKQPELKKNIFDVFQLFPLICYSFMDSNNLIEGTDDTFQEIVSISVDLSNILKKT